MLFLDKYNILFRFPVKFWDTDVEAFKVRPYYLQGLMLEFDFKLYNSESEMVAVALSHSFLLNKVSNANT